MGFWKKIFGGGGEDNQQQQQVQQNNQSRPVQQQQMNQQGYQQLNQIPQQNQMYQNHQQSQQGNVSNNLNQQNYNQNFQQQQNYNQNQIPQQQYHPNQYLQQQQQQQNYQQQQQNYQQQQQQQQQNLSQQEQEYIKSQIYGNQAIMPQNRQVQLPLGMVLLLDPTGEAYHMSDIKTQPKAPTNITQKKTVAIKNDLIIDRDSIRFEQDKNVSNVMNLTFDFTLLTDAIIGIYYCVSEEVNPQNNMTLKFNKQNPNYLQNNTYKFQQGEKLQFPLNLTPLDTKIFSRQQLTTKLSKNYYNLIIRMEKLDKTQEFKVFYTYCTLFYDEKFNLKVKVVKQKLELNGQAYVLNEVYGINESGVSGSEATKECVICYTDAPDCIIMPCKHMCLCLECCKTMRSKAEKCPICRGPIEEYIQLSKADSNKA